jgi:pheromone shutdown protein TraB
MDALGRICGKNNAVRKKNKETENRQPEMVVVEEKEGRLDSLANAG